MVENRTINLDIKIRNKPFFLRNIILSHSRFSNFIWS